MHSLPSLPSGRCSRSLQKRGVPNFIMAHMGWAPAVFWLREFGEEGGMVCSHKWDSAWRNAYTSVISSARECAFVWKPQGADRKREPKIHFSWLQSSIWIHAQSVLDTRGCQGISASYKCVRIRHRAGEWDWGGFAFQHPRWELSSEGALNRYSQSLVTWPSSAKLDGLVLRPVWVWNDNPTLPVRKFCDPLG